MGSKKKRKQPDRSVLQWLLTLPKWAYWLMGAISLVAAWVFNTVDAARFPFLGMALAVAVYLATVLSLVALGDRYTNDSESISIWGEFWGYVLFTAIGAVAGAAGGVVWWLFAEPGLVTFAEAIAKGALLGALVVIMLLSGSF